MFYKEITAEQQTDRVHNRIRRYQDHLNLYNLIIGLLPKYEGKKITEHIINHLNKHILTHYFWLDKSYGMFHIEARPIDSPMEMKDG
jgi:hypothetical protein